MDQNQNSNQKYVTYLIVICLIVFVLVSGFSLLYSFLQKNNDQPIPVTDYLSTTTQLPENSNIANQNEPTKKTTPTPTPLQGPGQYACSVGGDCKDWSPDALKTYCTTTFADRSCLNQCANINIRCKI